MKDLMGKARTIVIVSHAMGTIAELCQQVAWLHQGRLIASGPAQKICDQYLEFLSVGKVPVALEDF
jgi:ABC-type polysaccharide/polyol phosphate transport system ATPase subunit